MDEFIIIEAQYDSADKINSNNELTKDCKVLVGNTVYNFTYVTGVSVKDTMLTDLDVERITAKNRFLGHFESLEQFKESKVIVNSYIAIENIVYVCEPYNKYLLKVDNCFLLEEGATVEDGINAQSSVCALERALEEPLPTI